MIHIMPLFFKIESRSMYTLCSQSKKLSKYKFPSTYLSYMICQINDEWKPYSEIDKDKSM